MDKTLFKCDKCSRGFEKKYNYNRHIKQKICNEDKEINVESLITIDNDQNITCQYCGNTYEQKIFLNRHLKNTKSKCFKSRQSDSIIYKTTNPNLIKNQKIIYKTINKNNTINNYNNNTTNIAIQPVVNHNHITIAKHGQETISHITKEVMLKLLDTKSFTGMCTELMRLLYFNDEVPENKNWTIVYPKNKNAGLQLNKETNKFERVATDDIIDDKFSNMIDLLFPLIEEIDKEDRETGFLNDAQRRNVRRYEGHFGMVQISRDSQEIYESIKDMAYNERIRSMTTWKEQGHEGNHLSLKF